MPFFFFNDTATTEIYTLSLHDALPISREAVEVETVLNFEVEPWRRRLRRRSCHWPREDGNDNSYLCVRRRPSGELHFTPCASLETERGRDCSASIASCLPHA